MTIKDEPSTSKGQVHDQNDTRKAKGQNEQGVPGKNKTKPEPGTEGPGGHLDDQPQREDEYLSDVLNEFNPQRKNSEEPSSDADTAGKGGSRRSQDT